MLVAVGQMLIVISAFVVVAVWQVLEAEQLHLQRAKGIDTGYLLSYDKVF